MLSGFDAKPLKRETRRVIERAGGDAGLRADLSSSGGAGLVGFTADGAGAVVLTAEEKLRLRIDGADYGVVPDGTDVGAKLASLIAAVKIAGGGDIHLEPGVLLSSVAQVIDASGVKLIGKGAGFFNAATGMDPVTTLRYTGAAGADALTIAPASGAANNKLIGCGVVGIGIDGNGLAARGLVVKSVNNSEFDASVTGCTSVQTEWNTVAALADARDSQMNDVRYLRAYASGSQNGILLTTDSLGANISMNDFGYLYATHQNGYGVKIGNTDNNSIRQVIAARIAGGTGPGVVLGAGNGVTTLGARANVILHCSPGAGGLKAEGTATDVSPSVNNMVLFLDKENAAADPTIEVGATLSWGTNKRVLVGRAGLFSMAIADSAGLANTEIDNINGESLRIRNGSNKHVVLTDGTNEWSIAIDASGNLRFNRLTGTGVVQANNDFKFVGNVGFYNTTPQAKQTVTGSRGGNAALASLLIKLAQLGLITDGTTA